MSRLGNHRSWLLKGASICVLATFVLACSIGWIGKATDKQGGAKMSERMKTLCVGRFLVDLPADASVHIGRIFVSGYDVTSSVEESDQEYSERAEKIKAGIVESNGEVQHRVLESVMPISFAEGRGTVLTYNRRDAKAFEGKRIVTIEDIDVQGIVRISGVSITATAEGMALDSGNGLARLFERFRALAPDEIPQERGFCIGHAVVRDPYDHPENEGVVLFAGLPGHPDVNIVLSSMAGTDPAPRLLKRHAASRERRPFFMRWAFTNLRERERTINGLTGDELVIRVREPNFTTGYSFQWEVQGEPDDVLAPLLTLEFESGSNPVAGGKPLSSSLSEERMFELWERIASSIRLRPTNFDRS